ncbi:hypothetical protein BFP77_02040 [Maribacter sp. 4U21]|uniref:tetratricopeptide repeat protein n=1 Tax=Maribacter sp. 4U21 TaxID=1889779 RepID=UPI000C14DE48|nr:tetratricopeptide repeat protein [Maribacter sp. 4U21]PIB31372.1 hypothetical protein BFP77_02040 [Maribacter sp. 4U21]
MKKFIPLLFLFFMSALIFAQDEELKEKQQNLNNSINYTWNANKKLSDNNFIEAEVDYRKAIAKSPDNAAAPYNLGNAYYNNATFSEAFGRFKEAGETATNKKDKHKAYHNMGNVFMKRKDYAKAVEAYKEALRNNPKDEETRYNLALAKELLKKDEDKKDKNDENKDQKDKDDKKDKEGDNKDKKDQDKKDEGDEGDKGDKGDEQKDENKEGDGDKKEEQKKKPEQGDQPKEQQQPRPNQLSKQQIENLLRAMQNAEKKVQDKIDAKKVKGAKIKNEKDW